MYPGKSACSSSIGFCRDVERGDVGLCRDLQGWGYTGFALSKNWGGGPYNMVHSGCILGPPFVSLPM